MKNTRQKTNKKGFTMIEMIAVMVVIGVILSAVIPALTGAINNGRVASAAGTIRSLQTAATNYYNGNGGSYTGLTLATLASGNYLPAGVTGTNSWNGTITVAPDANASWFDITLTNVPTAQATLLTTQVANLVQSTPTYTAASQTWKAAF